MGLEWWNVIWEWISHQGRIDATKRVTPVPAYLTPSTWEVLVGVTLTVLGNIVISWGQISPKIAAVQAGGDVSTLMRVESHMPEIEEAAASKPPKEGEGATNKSVVQAKAFLYVGLGNMMHILGLWFAPASLLAPANAVGLFANQAFVMLFTDTAMTLPVGCAFIGIAVGIITCSVAADGAGPLTSSVAEYHRLILSSWSDPAYLFFIFMLMAVCGALIAATRYLREQRLRNRFETWISAPHWQTRKLMEHPEAAQIRNLFGYQSELRREEFALRDRQFSQLLSVCVACVAGMVGSQTVCQVKECEAVFKEALHNPTFLITSPLPLMAVILLVAEGFGQYYLLLPAYMEGDPITVSALYYTAWTLLGAIGGFVKFKEHQRLDSNQRMAFAVGLLLCSLSILLICYGSLYKLILQLFDSGPRREDQISPVRSEEGSDRRAQLMVDMTIPLVPRMMDIHGILHTAVRSSQGGSETVIPPLGSTTAALSSSSSNDVRPTKAMEMVDMRNRRKRIGDDRLGGGTTSDYRLLPTSPSRTTI